MNVALYIGHCGNEWVWELFPGKSPGELTLAGKNWVRFVLDLCSCWNVGSITIADKFFYEDLRRRLGDGAFWLTRIAVIPAAGISDPMELARSSGKADSPDDLLIFWGQTLPDLPEASRLLDELQPVTVSPGVPPEDGIYLLRGGTLYRCVCPLLRMNSLKSYFELNFRLLNSPGMYVLPGYAPANDNISLGENVILMPGIKILPPANIRGDSYIGRNVTLAGDVIIGRCCMVENNSTLKHAIVMDHTCLGRSLSLENKIACGNRVIDAETGAYVDLHDDFLLKSTGYRFSPYKAAEFLTALFLAVTLTPLYLLTRLLRPLIGKLPFFHFLLRIYPGCFKVLAGNARLVRLGMSDREYVFRFADSFLLLHDGHQHDVADVYFMNHKSVRLMLATVTLSLLKRMFVLSPLKAEQEDRP